MLLLAFASCAVSLADEVKQANKRDAYVGRIKQVLANGNVIIELSYGEIEIDKVEWVKITPPADMPKFIAAMQARQYTEVIKGLKPIISAYLGAPEQSGGWVADAAAMLVEAHLGQKEFTAASDLCRKIKDKYGDKDKHPTAVGAVKMADLGLIRSLAGQRQCNEALKAIAIMIEPAKKTLAVSPQDSALYARAYIAQGDCQATCEQWKDALTSYLTVTVLYYHDIDLLTEARYKAGLMYEKMRDWAHAAEIFKELLKDASPRSDFIEDTKKRMAAALEKVRPPGGAAP